MAITNWSIPLNRRSPAATAAGPLEPAADQHRNHRIVFLVGGLAALKAPNEGMASDAGEPRWGDRPGLSVVRRRDLSMAQAESLLALSARLRQYAARARQCGHTSYAADLRFGSIAARRLAALLIAEQAGVECDAVRRRDLTQEAISAWQAAHHDAA